MFEVGSLKVLQDMRFSWWWKFMLSSGLYHIVLW